jgi:hypothetical protein
MLVGLSQTKEGVLSGLKLLKRTGRFTLMISILESLPP